MVSENNFQFNHKQIGLTYPRATGLTKIELENFFNDWSYQDANGEEIRVKKYIIAMEHHEATAEDPVGGIHYHCYVGLNKKLRARNARLFDVEDVMGAIYHPFIDKVRGFKNMVRYITKEDENPIANFDYTDKDEQPDFKLILEKDFKNAIEFLDFMINTYPKYSFGKYVQLKALAYDRYEPLVKEYIPKYTVFNNVPFQAKCWVDNYLNGDFDRPLSLILIGETRTGKTSWARSLGRHMYFNGAFNLDLWDPQAKYAIFDDFDREEKRLEDYFPFWKQWFGAQPEFVVTDKYRKKMSIKWGKPIIFISNNEIDCKSRTLDYIKKNTIRINVYDSFY